ncbi:acyl-CoA N-acyltransferase [Gymnopus androsaceus JB14]|uniref:Acyl-CoA N-acyltransferase n=1 Tax=Gymnopus androsaceus JB14 TaxID=1447944 RepID=A0A6A4HZQ3_9AGAR|nr:acyl-CoA N-acyltransferase [Gymnopus androsaceus JB14]
MEYSYTVVPIPVPPLQRYVDRYAALRLLALGTNPECFSSTVEEAKTLTSEQWRERIDTPDRVTLVAVASKAPANTSLALLDEDTAEWLGLIAVLTPEFLKKEWESLPIKFQQFAMWLGAPAHILISMWVHPEHRRKGLGGKLISEAVEWVRQRSKGGAVVLEVFKTNVGAATLYREMGFVDIEEVEGSLWMGRSL